MLYVPVIGKTGRPLMPCHPARARELVRKGKAVRRFNSSNRAIGGIPPGTKARWQWKLRLCQWLAKFYPIACFVVEDLKAHTKGGKRWNQSFSPLQMGKVWLYSGLEKLARVIRKQGWEKGIARCAWLEEDSSQTGGDLRGALCG